MSENSLISETARRIAAESAAAHPRSVLRRLVCGAGGDTVSGGEHDDAARSAGGGARQSGGPVAERIETRGAVVGGLPIRRVLPNRVRRTVGAWCFFDHLGPVEHPAGGGLHVGPHPHIGLQTFTWVIDGEIVHRDSLGFEQVIRPGEINLMTAGGGIVHSEDSETTSDARLHATQLWIALPDAQRYGAAAFEHHGRLPIIDVGGMRATVLAGRAFGQESPARVYSELVGLDLAAADSAAVSVPVEPRFEHAALTLEGAVEVAGDALAPGVLLYLGRGREALEIRCTGPSRMILIGGVPFGEDILLWWNFVGRTREEIEEASAAWNAGLRFGEVRGSPSARLIAPELSGLALRASRP
jgi:quercetin 2,3-dioxygenase